MSNLNLESRIYRLTGLSPILGSAPAQRDIRTKYVASKAPTEALRDEEIAEDIDIDEKGLTVFHRDRQAHLCLMGHQIKGFFKQALMALKPQLKIAAPKGKVDTLLFVEPRYIPLTRDGQTFADEDEINERPLRADVQGIQYTALQASEQIDDPWTVEFEITLLPSTGTKTSSPLTWDAVETALDYGAYHGLGQWRNAGYGRFRWEQVDK